MNRLALSEILRLRSKAHRLLLWRKIMLVGIILSALGIIVLSNLDARSLQLVAALMLVAFGSLNVIFGQRVDETLREADHIERLARTL